MSRRGLVPLALAVGFGIANGYIVFNPALQQREAERIRKNEAMAASNLGLNLIEIPVSGTEAQREMDDMQHGNVTSPPSNMRTANSERGKS